MTASRASPRLNSADLISMWLKTGGPKIQRLFRRHKNLQQQCKKSKLIEYTPSITQHTISKRRRAIQNAI
jgi:hypothetical protein